MWAILTILIVGIVSFLIGLLLTNSKWKTKYEQSEKDNILLKTQITNLNNRVAKLEKAEKNAIGLYESARAEKDEIEDDRDRLKSNNIIVNRKLKESEASNNKQEIERLSQELTKAKKYRLELEADRNEWKSKALAGTNNAAVDTTNDTMTIQDTVTKPPQSLTYRMTTIFNRIGLRDPHNEDDLTKINGVGQEIAKKLNKIGIYNYKQLAQLEEKDLETIDEALEFTRGRAKRDGWIAQSLALYHKKYA